MLKLSFKHFFFLFGLLLLCASGVSILGTPRYEVLYDPLPMQGVCNDKSESCLYLYTLQVGNSGKEELNNVDVVFSKELLSSLAMPVGIRNFGKVQRKGVKVSEEQQRTSYALGKLEPEKRVDFSITLQLPSSKTAPDWDSLLLEVKPTRGKALEGSPEMTRFGRVMYTFFGW